MSERPTSEAEDDESTAVEETTEFYQYRTWVDHIIGDEISREMVLRSLGFSLVVFGLGFIIALLGNAGTAYLRSPSAYLIGVGILLTTLSYGWGSRKFLSLWSQIRGAFATSEENYNALVRSGLGTVYNDRAIFVEFTVAAVVIFFLQFAVPVPAAIQIGVTPVTEVFGVTVRYIDIINHVFGLVALLYIVTGVHMVTTALRLLYRVTHLPLEPPRVAANELEEFADFSAVAATMWFLVVVLILFVYRPYFGFLFDIGNVFGIAFWVIGTVVMIILVGVAIFLVPQLAIHSALVRRKRQRLQELDEELDSLLQTLQSDERGPEEISVALELHDRRLERVKNARTWLYDVQRLLQLAGSGTAAVLSLLKEAMSLSGLSL